MVTYYILPIHLAAFERFLSSLAIELCVSLWTCLRRNKNVLLFFGIALNVQVVSKRWNRKKGTHTRCSYSVYNRKQCQRNHDVFTSKPASIDKHTNTHAPCHFNIKIFFSSLDSVLTHAISWQNVCVLAVAVQQTQHYSFFSFSQLQKYKK